ncbi:MAG: thymidine phosphorylase [Calditrichaceae bacterium]|nr:thymidine phosphorylase [Calditrichaceae bacterium]RQV96292.1 MAG: thymidine phosphorylase [Calditrichota bacterium]
MTAYEIISLKRDGYKLSREQLNFMINGFTAGSIPDYQMAAFLMAVYFKGMDTQETRILTNGMLHSGEIIDLSDIEGIKVDKHSTGGVGDKVSAILAPIVAAAGVPLPMISGRGLGHTGGTLDKLESIPGFRIDYSIKEFKDKISEAGTCLIGQTPTICPADKKMYALRDVTATIQSVPLITGSIMSKKLAEGIDALVLDVKTGKGAFMSTVSEAENLAKNLMAVGKEFGKSVITFITNMDQPLGNAVGNWLEIRECIDGLQNHGPQDLMELTLQLSGAMIFLGKKADSIDEGYGIAQSMINSGKAWDKFLQIVKSQEGDISYLENPLKYPSSRYKEEITADKNGYIAEINALETGLAAVALGAGRQKSEDKIDPKAGIILHTKCGQKITKGETLFTVYSDRETALKSVCQRLTGAVVISDQAVTEPVLIHKIIDPVRRSAS